MIKNLIISALLTNVLFQISPYTFGTVDAIISGLCAFVVFAVIICDTEKTIIEHMSYKQRKKFRKLLSITNLRKEERA